MTRAPSETFAIGDAQQYRPTGTTGRHRVHVAGGSGPQYLAYDASWAGSQSGPAGPPPSKHPLFIIVHGAQRESARHLAYATQALGPGWNCAGPSFLADVDNVPPDVLRWSVEGWKGGYGDVSSFLAMDVLLLTLAGDGDVCMFGHSAGGRFLAGYAAVGMAPRVIAQSGSRVRFFISNPSTYLYFTRQRPVKVADGETGRWRANKWRYGFEDPPPYVTIGPAQALAWYARHDVTMILGGDDNSDSAHLLEISPPAKAQGSGGRLGRGLAYYEHLQRATRQMGIPFSHRPPLVVPGVGHSAGDILAAPLVQELIRG